MVSNGVNVVLDELIALRAHARGNEFVNGRASAIARAGTHVSRWRGRGVDFRESRTYQPGDDIRHMDWRVTARSGRPHTKVFQEEREQGLLLAFDLNPSLHFGTRVRFKSVQAARAAALLAWVAAQTGDRVGVLGFGGGITGEVRPAGGRRGVLRVLRAMRDWDKAADAHVTEPLSAALERVRRLLKPGMRLVIISDGYAADAAALPLLTRIAERHEIGVVIVSDALETTAPPPGRYAVSLNGTRRVFNLTNHQLRTEWPQRFAEGRTLLLHQVARVRARTIELDTRADPWHALTPFFTGGMGNGTRL